MNNAMALALKTQPFVEIDASMRKTGITMSVEMNVYTLINNAMAPALKTEPFVEIDASKRNILKDAVILLSTPVEIVVFKILNHAMVLALEIEFFAMVDVINQKTAGAMRQNRRRRQ